MPYYASDQSLTKKVLLSADLMQAALRKEFSVKVGSGRMAEFLHRSLENGL